MNILHYEGCLTEAVRREADPRRIAVAASVSGRDFGSTASEVRHILTDQLKLPACLGIAPSHHEALRFPPLNVGWRMDRKAHWQHVYRTKAADEVSWFQPEPTISARLLEAAGLSADT